MILTAARFRSLFRPAQCAFSSQDKRPIRRMVIKNYKSQKTQEPQIVQIDAQTNQVSLLTPLRNRSLRSSASQLQEKLQTVFLPADYPHSVTKEYLPFAIYSNISSLSISAMMFISTQALFVALGG